MRGAANGLVPRRSRWRGCARLAGGIALVWIAGACATVQRSGGREVCLTEELLRVRNETTGPVEVYSVRAGVESSLGTADAGVREFPLPKRAADESWSFIGRTPSGAYVRSNGTGSRLEFRVVCR